MEPQSFLEYCQEKFLCQHRSFRYFSENVRRSKKKLNYLNTFLVEKDFDSFSKYNNYDLIASNMSLHWSENFFELLNKILSMMRVNAFFIFSVPNNKSFQILKKKSLVIL